MHPPYLSGAAGHAGAGGGHQEDARGGGQLHRLRSEPGEEGEPPAGVRTKHVGSDEGGSCVCMGKRQLHRLRRQPDEPAAQLCS
jgi:hypothetical protein